MNAFDTPHFFERPKNGIWSLFGFSTAGMSLAYANVVLCRLRTAIVFVVREKYIPVRQSVLSIGHTLYGGGGSYTKKKRARGNRR